MADKIDKVYDLIEKMYIEFSGKFEKIDGRLDKLEGGQEKLSNQMIRFENEIKEDTKALYDGYKLTYEKLQEHDKRFDNIESELGVLNVKTNKQESEIKVLKGGY